MGLTGHDAPGHAYRLRRQRRSYIAALALVLPVLLSLFASSAAAAPAPTDVMFVFDTSGSMESVLEEAKAEIGVVMERLRATVPDPEFGVAEVKDTGEEEAGIFAWKLAQPVTPEASAVTGAISGLSAFGGGDGPEAYGRALYETDTNPSVGWRAGARHLIVLIADEVPHMPNVNEGIPEEFWMSNPFEAGEEVEATAGIASTQWTPGVNIQFTSDLARLAHDGKPLEMVDFHDTEGDFIHYWEHWAGLAGGVAVESEEGGHDLAERLVPLIEHAPEDTACATSASASPASPASHGGLPTAVTPRFLQAGSTVSLTAAAGREFCVGEQPDLGGSVVSGATETPAGNLVFQVPPTASSGLSLVSLGGGVYPATPFSVDNFRYPWGLNIINGYTAGTGGYESGLSVSSADVDAVFHVEPDILGFKFRESAAAREAESDMRSILKGGLCYGFSLSSWELYLDAHGQHLPLEWASSPGFALSPGALPYAQTESGAGAHSLTRVLMRAAVSQYSPEAQARFQPVGSAAALEQKVKPAFERGRPVPILIFFNGEGHAMLAFNYQTTPEGGVDIDVIDPNVPFGEAPWERPETEAFPQLQVKMKPNGSWEFAGSFSGFFTDHVGGASGSLDVVPEPLLPGHLLLPSSSLLAHFFTYIHPPAGSAITSIGYGHGAGHGIPSDAKPEPIADESADNRMVVPSGHHTVTVTTSATTGAPGPIGLTGYGFIDYATPGVGRHQVTVASPTGALSVPDAGNGTELSVTRVIDGAQREARVRFSGHVHAPSLSVSPTGTVTIIGAGKGRATFVLSEYSSEGMRARTSPQGISIHGHTRVRRHIPKAPHRRHHRHHRKRRR